MIEYVFTVLTSIVWTLLVISLFMIFTAPKCQDGLVAALSSPQVWECVIKPDRKMTIYYKE